MLIEPTTRCHAALPAATTMAIAMLAAPPLWAQQACECSCESYREMLQAAEEARAAAESGNFNNIPARVAQMGQCAGQCAVQWAQCATPGADSSNAGNRPAPNAAEQLLRRTEQRDAQPEPAAGLPKDRLTAAYLQGMWCSVYGGQEVTQWRFDEQGRYEIGVPAGGGFAMQGNLQSLDHFRQRFDRLVALESDTFTTEHQSGRTARENVFTRGPCD